MGSCIRFVGCLALLYAGQSFAQVLTDHAAAGVGGSVGAAAGKPVSKGLGKILGQTKDNTEKAAQGKPVSKKPAATRVTDDTPAPPKTHVGPGGAGAPSMFLGGSAGETSRPRRVDPDAPAATPSPRSVASTPAPVSAPPVPVRILTAEDVARIHVGMQKSEVTAALGEPGSAVTIPDEGHLLQILRYNSGSRYLGTVRLDNGAVVSVDLAK